MLVLIRYNNLADPARRFLFLEEDLSYYGLFLCHHNYNPLFGLCIVVYYGKYRTPMGAKF